MKRSATPKRRAASQTVSSYLQVMSSQCITAGIEFAIVPKSNISILFFERKKHWILSKIQALLMILRIM
ncbi:hypothetical protein BIFCAT_01910 [Bifidobacterium catenulatum DSM 16992 = JCM 1194 = LMG 11043]|uniref:Uncharacterized protein n=1 Tax=Bifidobacterium catenulatum DSM 16992 = JCM 1194 = LMG 11043 TaxID=566552 RepID=B6XX45_9BIFI|nr:hypothetical protein BIFCAT_01910 [Bifidobacterium catenulatum DSM 16992 = JCM 1194 = LMG 11043]